MIKISPDGITISDDEMLSIFRKHGAEHESIFRRYEMNEVIEYTGGMGIDIGCGLNKIHSRAIGVDKKLSEKDYGYPFGAQIKADGEKLDWFRNETLDYVFSSHCLEHFKDPISVLAEWNRVVKLGGLLVLILPHKDLYPNVGKRLANPDHKRDYYPRDVVELLNSIGGFQILSIDSLTHKLSANPWRTREAVKYGHKSLNFSFEVVARKIEAVPSTRI